MVRSRFAASAIALLAGVVVMHPDAGRAAADGCAWATAVTASSGDRHRATRAVLCLVNRRRAGHGLRPLRVSGQLSAAARFHGADMVAHGYFSHEGSAGDSLQTRVRRSGYAASHPDFDVGEALAWGQQTSADGLVQALMRSAVHRRILLAPAARDLGIGVAVGAPVAGVAGPSWTLVLDVGA